MVVVAVAVHPDGSEALQVKVMFPAVAELNQTCEADVEAVIGIERPASAYNPVIGDHK